MATAVEILTLISLWCGKPGDGANVMEVRGCRKTLLVCLDKEKRDGKVANDKVWECLAQDWKNYKG